MIYFQNGGNNVGNAQVGSSYPWTFAINFSVDDPSTFQSTLQGGNLPSAAPLPLAGAYAGNKHFTYFSIALKTASGGCTVTVSDLRIDGELVPASGAANYGTTPGEFVKGPAPSTSFADRQGPTVFYESTTGSFGSSAITGTVSVASDGSNCAAEATTVNIELWGPVDVSVLSPTE